MTLPAHPLTNFEIQEYYQNEPRFNGVFSRDNLGSAVKNGAYVINLDEHHDIGTHWVALYINNKTVTYFDSFGVEHIAKEIMKFIACKKIITNIYRIFFDQPIKNNKVTYDNIRKIATGQGDDYKTGCLLEYPYFANTYKMIAVDLSKQAYDSIMCGYFCIGFINFMFNGKSLTDYTNLFSPNDFKKNDDIILKYFGLQDVK